MAAFCLLLSLVAFAPRDVSSDIGVVANKPTLQQLLAYRLNARTLEEAIFLTQQGLPLVKTPEDFLRLMTPDAPNAQPAYTQALTEFGIDSMPYLIATRPTVEQVLAFRKRVKDFDDALFVSQAGLAVAKTPKDFWTLVKSDIQPANDDDREKLRRFAIDHVRQLAALNPPVSQFVELRKMATQVKEGVQITRTALPLVKTADDLAVLADVSLGKPNPPYLKEIARILQDHVEKSNPPIPLSGILEAWKTTKSPAQRLVLAQAGMAAVKTPWDFDRLTGGLIPAGTDSEQKAMNRLILENLDVRIKAQPPMKLDEVLALRKSGLTTAEVIRIHEAAIPLIKTEADYKKVLTSYTAKPSESYLAALAELKDVYGADIAKQIAGGPRITPVTPPTQPQQVAQAQSQSQPQQSHQPPMGPPQVYRPEPEIPKFFDSSRVVSSAPNGSTIRSHYYSPDVTRPGAGRDPGSCTNVGVANRGTIRGTRDQGSMGWCFAYTASDLISQKLGFEVSAVDVALAFFAGDEKRQSRVTDNVSGYAYKAIESASRAGFCRESALPSDHFGDEYLKDPANQAKIPQVYKDAGRAWQLLPSNLAEIRSMLVYAEESQSLMQQGNAKAACEKYPGLLPLFPNVDARSFGEALSRSITQDSLGFVQNLANKSCQGKRVFLETPIEIKVTRPASFADQQSLISAVDEALEQGLLAGITYRLDPSFVKPESMLKMGASGQDFFHASSIMERRFNSATGTCEYLIRNSWGQRCDMYTDAYQANCDRATGSIWVPAEMLKSNLRETYYVK